MQQMTESETLQNEINRLCEEAEFEFKQDKTTKYKDKILSLVRLIEAQLAEESLLTKQQRVKLYFLKGKVYDILPEYSKQAEESLTRAMKLAPQDPDNLVTLGHILWKKKDFEGSKQCLENAIESNPQHVKALQYLSIVMRQMGKDNQTRSQNVAQSVEIAKKALLLDLQNGQSWYLMGNAFLSDYFTNPKKDTSQLSQALKAFNNAENKQKHPNPDLYYNRGNLLCYFEDYTSAFQDYDRAVQIDPTLGTEKQRSEIQKLASIKQLLDTKCGIAQKKLANIVKQIPTGLKRPDQKLVPISELKVGANPGVVLSCKALKAYTDQRSTPAGFIVIDSTSNVGALSVYNCSEDIYEKIRDNSDIYVVEPNLKEITFGDNKWLAVQVFEIHKMFVQDERVVSVFSPPVAVNQTFEK